MKMKHLTKTCYILPLLLAATGTAHAQDAWGDDVSKMVTEGKASLDFRYRFENVDQENFNKDATANTLRSRITLATAPWGGFSALLEMDNVSDFGSDDYNSTGNGKTQYPVIADPEGTDLNQAYFKYAGETMAGILGRQRINHGNQRFIGGVGWRQNEQTYDGLRGTWEPMELLKIDLSYVANVSRIFGPDDGAQPADLEGDNYFLRADYTITPEQKIAAYGYSLDFDTNDDYSSGKTVDNSGTTYGLEYSGKFDWFSLAAAYATQSDSGSSTLDYDADYYMVELGANFGGIGFKGGYEVLGAGDGVGFKTPLATLHKFQGWADKFLGTPGDGIEDMYVGVNGKLGPVKLAAIYHDFQAEETSEDYGTEVDLVATWPINKQFSVQAKYASFSADSSRYDDTDKGWVTLQLKL
jgi:hypothetical protein